MDELQEQPTAVTQDTRVLCGFCFVVVPCRGTGILKYGVVFSGKNLYNEPLLPIHSILLLILSSTFPS